MVNYQLAKRRAGTHKTKTRGEVARTGRKFVAQKGSGGARHSSKRAPIFIGGGIAFGPVPRSHGFSLPKKVRALALKIALSTKARAGKLLIVDNLNIDSAKTKDLAVKFENLNISTALIVGGNVIDQNFANAVSNLYKYQVLPVQGANVYDILRRDTLILSAEAVKSLEERLK